MSSLPRSHAQPGVPELLAWWGSVAFVPVAKGGSAA